MTKTLSDAQAFCGCIRLKNIRHLYFCLDEAIGEDAVTICSTWDTDEGEWTKTIDEPVVEWEAISCSVTHSPKTQAVAIGAWGQALIEGHGELREETIRSQTKAPIERRGKMLRVRGIGKRAYAVGMGRQVYRRDGVDTWTAIDDGCLMKDTKPIPKGVDQVEAMKARICGFFSIDGFDEKDIYAVGVHGEIWHFSGKKWKQLDSPTNVTFNDVICAGDGQVYAVADDGLLACGREDNWSVVSDPAFNDSVYSLAWFNDQLYLAGLRGVFIRDDKGKIKPVKWGKDKPKTTGQLSAREGFMWSIGAKDIMEFDGKAWKRIDP